MSGTPSRPVLAVEIGGTKLQAALGDASGRIHHVLRARAGATPEAILAWFEESVPELLAQVSAPPEAIGIGFGGPVDDTAGKVLVSHQVEGWSGYPLSAWFSDRFGLPTALINDSNAAGWAEYVLGAGKGARHFCYLNIGSGIGGALIVDGKLHNGQGIGAAEYGHTMAPDWRNPGSFDRLENLCSGWAIERYARAQPIPEGMPLHNLSKGDPAAITCAMLGEAAKAGDAFALDTLERVADTIGLAIANVITVVHPETFALGGGVSLIGEPLLAPMRAAVKHYVFQPYVGTYELLPCALAEDVVLAGALLIAGADA